MRRRRRAGACPSPSGGAPTARTKERSGAGRGSSTCRAPRAALLGRPHRLRGPSAAGVGPAPCCRRSANRRAGASPRWARIGSLGTEWAGPEGAAASAGAAPFKRRRCGGAVGPCAGLGGDRWAVRGFAGARAGRGEPGGAEGRR